MQGQSEEKDQEVGRKLGETWKRKTARGRRRHRYRKPMSTSFEGPQTIKIEGHKFVEYKI